MKKVKPFPNLNYDYESKEKIYVSRNIDYLYVNPNDFVSPIDFCRCIIKIYKKAKLKGFVNIQMKEDVETYDGEETTKYFICGQKEETDEEYTERQKGLKNKQEYELKQEKLQYERLKKKFEPTAVKGDSN